MNLVMFGYFVTGNYFADMTDINLKEYMFKQKMREIEEDIVPFGHIDDGSEYEEERQSREQLAQWGIYRDGDENW